MRLVNDDRIYILGRTIPLMSQWIDTQRCRPFSSPHLIPGGVRHAAYVKPGEGFGSGQRPPSFASIWKTSLAHKSEDPARYAIMGWQQDPQQKWGSIMKKKKKSYDSNIQNCPHKYRCFWKSSSSFPSNSIHHLLNRSVHLFLCTPAHQTLTQDKHCYVV